MSSNSVALLLFVMLLFLASSPTISPNAVFVAAARPLNSERPREYATLEPKPSPVNGSFNQSRSVESCLPKGRRYNSAPSRYINYQPLGSSLCTSPSKNDTREP
ncbi:hypothetical protein CDL15_Pgr026067 [Punica granatum]|uniref:Uncharacterized protein n=1 Tax=Punica granatum TaxID=22663 RepID=A0A218WBG9_PUNGR|nr:hypothetical protein CDL15_Pgr026067 [Punica granatum]PKI46743.1 hypothetical protein CRG98_032883 [Punica granatum]